jgi:hypothetical protein
MRWLKEDLGVFLTQKLQYAVGVALAACGFCYVQKCGWTNQLLLALPSCRVVDSVTDVTANGLRHACALLPL